MQYCSYFNNTMLIIIIIIILILCHKISYAAYLLSMTPKNFLRYDNRGGRTQLK